MFHKEKDRLTSALRIEEKNGDWKPVVCLRCGKFATVCPTGAIKQLSSSVWTIDKNSAPDAENAARYARYT